MIAAAAGGMAMPSASAGGPRGGTLRRAPPPRGGAPGGNIARAAPVPRPGWLPPPPPCSTGERKGVQRAPTGARRPAAASSPPTLARPLPNNHRLPPLPLAYQADGGGRSVRCRKGTRRPAAAPTARAPPAAPPGGALPLNLPPLGPQLVPTLPPPKRKQARRPRARRPTQNTLPSAHTRRHLGRCSRHRPPAVGAVSRQWG